MDYDISSHLAHEIRCLQDACVRLLALRPAPAPHHLAAIQQLLRDLDILPAIVAESHLLQALGTPASRLRAIERAMQGASDASAEAGGGAKVLRMRRRQPATMARLRTAHDRRAPRLPLSSGPAA